VASSFRTIENWFPVAILAVSLGFNVYFLAIPRGAVNPHPTVTGSVAVGKRVPALAAAELSGRHSLIEWAADSRPAVLYVFSPSCVWCLKNLPNAKALWAGCHDRYRFVALSPTSTGLAEYVAAHALPFQVYSNPVGREGQAFAVSGTPTTMVISNGGEVERLWVGAYTGQSQEEIQAYFGIALPGIVR
jgi:hypothetical protein